MAELSESFDVLMDRETYTTAIAGLAGYMAGYVARNLVENRASIDVPDEAYGLGVIALTEVTGAAGYKRPVQTGAGVHSAEMFADRVGVRDTVMALGGA
jgi:hypothetical protein